MTPRGSGGGRRVAVVTGGAAGIGAAIAEELGRRGYCVVTLDPVVALDGSPIDAAGETTAARIVAAGGDARASNTSVTDDDAVGALFADLAGEFGAIDAVVNVAGISRPTGFATGTEDDWARVLDVHLNGYLTVLRNALAHMAAAGRGRIVGVTSGSGWRAGDAGAYSCAKRAVASLTWQLGTAAPPGVTVNALSPIAATRMVAGALARAAAAGNTSRSGRTAGSGGVALAAAPPPEHLGPIGAFLAGDDLPWCRGQVIFSAGSEASVVAPPRLLEMLRTTDAVSVAHALDTAVPATFVPAEAQQSSTGGSVPRFTGAFDAAATAPRRDGHCVVVADDPARARVLTDALAARGATCTTVTAPAGGGFADAADALARAAGAGPLDAVVVALDGTAASAVEITWERILAEHADITDRIRTDAAWVRAAADHAARAEWPVRIVTVTDATTAGGRSRAMAAAQLARAARGATGERVLAFAIAVETAAARGWAGAAALAAHTAFADGVEGLSGAELVAADDWVGLRSHPQVAGTVSYGGPEVPGWLGAALRRLVPGAGTGDGG